MVIEPPVLLTPLERISQLKAQIAAEEGHPGKRTQLPPLEIRDMDYEQKKLVKQDFDQQDERRVEQVKEFVNTIEEHEEKRQAIRDRVLKAARSRLEKNYRDEALTPAERQRRKRGLPRKIRLQVAGMTPEEVELDREQRKKDKLKRLDAKRKEQRAAESPAKAKTRRDDRNEKLKTGRQNLESEDPDLAEAKRFARNTKLKDARQNLESENADLAEAKRFARNKKLKDAREKLEDEDAVLARAKKDARNLKLKAKRALKKDLQKDGKLSSED